MRSADDTARRVAWLPVAVVAGTTFAVLLATAGRYGYHRDELYFLEAGRHPAWGYPDQPPLVPLLAHALEVLGGGSLVVLRLLPALVVAIVVLCSGALAARLGAARQGQLLASTTTAASTVVLAMGHLLSTATLGLLGWVVLTLLLLRLLEGADRRWWVAAGLVAGVTAQANPLVGFLLLAVGAVLVVAGPRELLRERWLWVGTALAALLAAPYLVWQARHGWPQLDVARGIAHGASGSSSSRLAFLPLLVLQASPWLAPVWLGGLLALLRHPRRRVLGWTFLVLTATFLLLGGKPYYVAGLLPLLLAAGSQPLLDRVRHRWVAPALVLLSLPAAIVALPVLPLSAAHLVVPVDYDAGETIGWPQLVGQVATAYASLPRGTAILTGNYGEAGAVDRFGARWHLPQAFSGHNGFGLWGAPPSDAAVLAVGVDEGLLRRSCRSLRPLGVLSTPFGVHNEEDGTRLVWCEPARPWAQLWPAFTHLG